MAFNTLPIKNIKKIGEDGTINWTFTGPWHYNWWHPTSSFSDTQSALLYHFKTMPWQNVWFSDLLQMEAHYLFRTRLAIYFFLMMGPCERIFDQTIVVMKLWILSGPNVAVLNFTTRKEVIGCPEGLPSFGCGNHRHNMKKWQEEVSINILVGFTFHIGYFFVNIVPRDT